MALELVILIVVVMILIAGWLKLDMPSGSRFVQGDRRMGIRRERAFFRKKPAGHPKLFQTAVEAKGRKIYLDLYQGSQQPYVTISEVGYSKDDKDAYTIIVYGDELRGLHKAIEACLKRIP